MDRKPPDDCFKRVPAAPGTDRLPDFGFPEKTWSVVDSLAPAEQITVMPRLAAGRKPSAGFLQPQGQAG